MLPPTLNSEEPPIPFDILLLPAEGCDYCWESITNPL